VETFWLQLNSTVKGKTHYGVICNSRNSNRFPALDELCINTLRFLAVDMVQKANSGHPWLPMGSAAMAYALWDRSLKFNPHVPIGRTATASFYRRAMAVRCSMLCFTSRG
jgi:hypothetical protein